MHKSRLTVFGLDEFDRSGRDVQAKSVPSIDFTGCVATAVNAGLKLPENQRFEIVGFFALLGRILWFDPRRECDQIAAHC